MYVVLLLFIVLQRLAELQIASSNVAHLKRRGGVEFGRGHYPFMVALHTFWLLSCLLEWKAGSSVPARWVAAGWLFFLAGQALRWTTIRTLGRRWTTRVIILPGAEPVKEGPFRFLNHPNYLGVALEVFGLPLVGGCWRTALLFGSLNLLLLRHRIGVENKALRWGIEGKTDGIR